MTIMLQARGRMTADSLAAEFEVSPRTIYRDIDALSAAGVPVYADRGPGGGFALLDGYRTRLTGLSRDEAASLALAGLPEAARATGFGPALRDGFGKLLAALPAASEDGAGRMAARIHIDPADWYRGGEAVAHLPLLAQATLAQRTATFEYESWTQQRSWRADPLGLVLKAGEWYLVAATNKRITTFRAAAMADVSLAETGFERPDSFDLARWWQEAQRSLDERLFTISARLRISPLGCERLARLSPRGRSAIAAAGPPDPQGWVEIELSVEDSDHGIRDLIALGPEFTVVAPDALRTRVATMAQAIKALHSNET